MASDNKLSDGLLRDYDRNSYRLVPSAYTGVSVVCNFYRKATRLVHASHGQSLPIRNSRVRVCPQITTIVRRTRCLHVAILDIYGHVRCITSSIDFIFQNENYLGYIHI